MSLHSAPQMYRQKSKTYAIEFEAYQFHNRIGSDTRPKWILDAEKYDRIKFIPRRGQPDQLRVITPSGETIIDVDDWVIPGVTNELYACPADLFAKMYEPVDTIARGDHLPATVKGEE